MRPSKPFSSLRDCAIGLPTSASACAPASRARPRPRRGSARSPRCARRAASPPTRGCAARARCALAAHARRVVGGTSAIGSPVGGIGDLHASVTLASAGPPSGRASTAVRRSASRARRVPRRGIRRAAAGRRACPRRARWNSGCHCTAAMYEPRGRRIASIMPSSGQRASTTKPGARSLIAWWCTLLTVAERVPSKTRASRDPGTNSTAWRLRSYRLRVAMARPRPGAGCRCPGSSVPPNATFSICRPRQTPSTGLPARRRRRAAPARSRRGCGRRSHSARSGASP